MVSVVVPLAYIGFLFGSLALFSKVYRGRQSSQSSSTPLQHILGLTDANGGDAQQNSARRTRGRVTTKRASCTCRSSRSSPSRRARYSSRPC